MSFFPHKYVVSYGHCQSEFQSYKEETMIVKAVDEEDATNQVLLSIHDKYPFYKIFKAEKLSDFNRKKKAKR